MTHSSPSLPFFCSWLRATWHIFSFDQDTLNTACASDASACNRTEWAPLWKPDLKIQTRESLKGVHDLFLSPSFCGLSPYSHLHLKESNPPSICHEMDRIRRWGLSDFLELYFHARILHTWVLLITSLVFHRHPCLIIVSRHRGFDVLCYSQIILNLKYS